MGNRYFLWTIIITLIVAILAGVYFFKPQEPLISTPQDVNSIILADIKTAGIDCGVEGCKIDKVFGDYAKGVMPMAYWIAKKTNDKWQVVVKGNGIPYCSEIDTYQIPLEIYGNCILETGDLRN